MRGCSDGEHTALPVRRVNRAQRATGDSPDLPRARAPTKTLRARSPLAAMLSFRADGPAPRHRQAAAARHEALDIAASVGHRHGEAVVADVVAVSRLHVEAAALEGVQQLLRPIDRSSL